MTDTLDKYFHDPQEEPEQKKELLIYDEYGWYISSYYFLVDGDWTVWHRSKVLWDGYI